MNTAELGGSSRGGIIIAEGVAEEGHMPTTEELLLWKIAELAEEIRNLSREVRQLSTVHEASLQSLRENNARLWDFVLAQEGHGHPRRVPVAADPSEAAAAGADEAAAAAVAEAQSSDDGGTLSPEKMRELLERPGNPDLIHQLLQAERSGEREAWADDDDTAAWSRLSAPAFARDWDSEADRIYDDEPQR